MKPFRQLLLKRYHIFILPGFVALVIVLLTYTILIPTTRNLFDTRDSINSKQEQLTRLKKKRALLESLNREQVLSQVEDAQAALPQEKDAGSVLIALENLSSITKYSVDAVSFSPGLISSDSAAPRSVKTPANSVATTSKSGANTFPISIQSRGTHQQFVDFLKNLQQSRRIFDIDSINITYDISKTDLLTADFSVSVYYLPAITKIGTIESPIAEITQKEKELLTKLASFPDLNRSLATGTAVSTEPVGKSNLFSL